jgi:hypothetical protein
MEKGTPSQLSAAMAPNFFHGIGLFRHWLFRLAEFSQRSGPVAAVGTGDRKLCVWLLIPPPKDQGCYITKGKSLSGQWIECRCIKDCCCENPFGAQQARVSTVRLVFVEIILLNNKRTLGIRS